MDAELKPLYANLRRLGISNYLVDGEFKNSLIETDLDGEWNECLAEFEITKSSRKDDYEEAFAEFIQKIRTKSIFLSESNELLVEVILNFFRWSSLPVEYKIIYECLKNLDFDKDLLKSFAEQARKANDKKNDKSVLFTSKAAMTTRDQSKVFIIHGHDKLALLELEKLLKEEFGLTPVIIQESPNDGVETIISKFERLSSECTLAIALLTPDDRTSENAFRARQNVILEFGYFMGRDRGGNRKIIVLKKGKVEIPSDIDGVLYMNFNESVNEIHLQLKKQLLHWKLIKG